MTDKTEPLSEDELSILLDRISTADDMTTVCGDWDHDAKYIVEVLHSAAATLQAQQAEIERLRGALTPSIRIKWSEPRKPNKDCLYSHVVAETLIGLIYIEWKEWKAYEYPTCSLYFNDDATLICGDEYITDANYNFIPEGLDCIKGQVASKIASVFAPFLLHNEALKRKTHHEQAGDIRLGAARKGRRLLRQTESDRGGF